MATARALRFLAARPWPSTTHRNLQHQAAVAVHRRFLSATSASTTTTTKAGGAGDPALHSGDAPSEEYTERPPRFSAAEDATTTKQRQPSPSSKQEEIKQERVPPFGPSGKLGSQELADAAAGSWFTQKRRFSSENAARQEATPGCEESAARKVREEDREYYRTHKPSPLAEVEFADTRKPVTQATDGGAADRLSSDLSMGTTVEDTADDSLARAEALFREAASRGNPEWPHSRALARMLARRNQQGNSNDAPWSS